MTSLLISMFTAHIIGDFYLQTTKLANAKRSSFPLLILHCVLYSLPFGLLYLLSSRHDLLLSLLLMVTLTHLPVDLIKHWVSRAQRNQPDGPASFRIFSIDQLIHFGIIAAASAWYFERGLTIGPASQLNDWFIRLNFNLFPIARWLLVLLIILKPASILVADLSANYHPERQAASSPENKRKSAGNQQALYPGTAVQPQNKESFFVGKVRGAGQMIGFLERILIVIFLSVGQYASIGLIMTAKSVARYERITKDSEFAEYYLIGTLSSFLIAILAFLIVFRS